MKATITEMHSIKDAIRTLYMSKRSWNQSIDDTVDAALGYFADKSGRINWHWINDAVGHADTHHDRVTQSGVKIKDMIDKLFKWGQKHTTMLRFLDASVVVEGLHRGATDDFDAHAKRLENRIIRSSTRLADYTTEEMSDWYNGKIIPTDTALSIVGMELPDEINYNGIEYVRSTNGYIVKGMEDNRDVKRGLYMLSLPMTFTFKVNIVELAHIYRERGTKAGGANGTAAPELQEMMEQLMDQLEEWYPQLTREYLLGIRN